MNGSKFEGSGGVQARGGLDVRPGAQVIAAVGEVFTVECYGRDGSLKWRDEFRNLVVAEGLNELIDKTFRASGYSAAWYVGLTDGTPTFAAGDTLASHAGWVEVTDYSEGARQTLTLAAPSGGSASNAASKAVFSINGTATVGGCFVCNAATGTAGMLFGGGAFSEGDRSVVNGDTLNVQVTLSVSAA